MRQEVGALRDALRRSGGLVQALQSRATLARRAAEDAAASIDEQVSDNASLRAQLDSLRAELGMLSERAELAEHRAMTAEADAAKRLSIDEAAELREATSAAEDRAAAAEAAAWERARVEAAAAQRRLWERRGAPPKFPLFPPPPSSMLVGKKWRQRRTHRYKSATPPVQCC